MTFLGVLRRVALRHDRGRFLPGRIVLGHLNDDLDPALVSYPDREQLADRGGQGVLTPGLEGGPALRLGRHRRHGPLVLSARQTAQPSRLGDRLLVGLAVLETIPDVRDRQLVPRPQPADLHPLAVDPDAIGAAQVPHDHFAILLGHAAMVSRDPQRIQAGITRRMATHHYHGAVQHDVWTFIECHQS